MLCGRTGSQSASPKRHQADEPKKDKKVAHWQFAKANTTVWAGSMVLAGCMLSATYTDVFMITQTSVEAQMLCGRTGSQSLQADEPKKCKKSCKTAVCNHNGFFQAQLGVPMLLLYGKS